MMITNICLNAQTEKLFFFFAVERTGRFLIAAAHPQAHVGTLPMKMLESFVKRKREQEGDGSHKSERFTADEITPPPDFGRDSFCLGQLLAHALSEKYSGLFFVSCQCFAHSAIVTSVQLTLGSMNNGTPKSTAFRRMT